jgi:hypothetical protein
MTSGAAVYESEFIDNFFYISTLKMMLYCVGFEFFCGCFT